MGIVRKRSKESRGTWTSKSLVIGKARSSRSWSKKGKHAWTAQIDKILALSARGMTTREIEAQLQELSGVEVSASLISHVTEAVRDEVRKFQTRPLEALYPILSVDGLVVNVRENQRVIKKALYLVLAVNWNGHKELLGMWLAQSEGAKFWLSGLDSPPEAGRERYLHCLCGWTHRLARSD